MCTTPKRTTLGLGREPLLEQGQHPRNQLLPAPDPIHRHHPAFRVERENRLDVEHARQPCLAARHPAGAEEVVVPVHRQQHTRLAAHPLELRADVRARHPDSASSAPRSASMPTPSDADRLSTSRDAGDPAARTAACADA